ncbi:CGG triplet repeat-binding protein 1 [Frankliniella fusca]|uniref:CGG triplet repeat-binding protein 1 n=1 Tax=Frankliniella fusca TaxID=407009 RepID=A0AAE1HCX7_9NEOP|nr:CGG triplet repeat-binding protein 1 [Frankliniella fusca]
MFGRGRGKVTITCRLLQYKDDGMYLFDSQKQLMACSFCDTRVDWTRKSVIDAHIASKVHVDKKANHRKGQGQNDRRQVGITECLSKAQKAKDDREAFIKSTVHAFVKANIPLHKLDHPSIRQWFKDYCPGGGDLPNSKWLRQHYLPLIKKDYDEEIKKGLQNKKIAILCDETTNRKGEAAFIVLFQILPDDENTDPNLIVAGVKILNNCNGDETSKALLQVMFECDVLHENVVALVSDSAAYMTLCVNLLKSLGLPNLIHVQCWAHKLDKIVKVFSDQLENITECVSKTKKLFKNTRKRKHRYQKYLKDKYSFSGKKEVKHFPLPVMTRWGSWRKSVVYLCDYLLDVVDFAKSLPIKEAPSVEYFHNLTEIDIKIIQAEAAFVKENCTPVSELLLELESSGKAFAHLLYPKLTDLCKPFLNIKLATNVQSVLSPDCKKFLDDDELPINKCNYLEAKIKQVAECCHDKLTKYMSEDPAKHFFRSARDLFNHTKIVLGSVSETAIVKAKESVKLFDTIPNDQFKILHGLFCDHVRDVLKANPKLGAAAVLRALEAMRGTYPEFVKKCLQCIYISVSNVDSERGFSAYGDIMSPKRTRLSKENTEVMMCLYFGDDPNNNEPSMCNINTDTDAIEIDDTDFDE